VSLTVCIRFGDETVKKYIKLRYSNNSAPNETGFLAVKHITGHQIYELGVFGVLLNCFHDTCFDSRDGLLFL
jgi:hypothetical protein